MAGLVLNQNRIEFPELIIVVIAWLILILIEYHSSRGTWPARVSAAPLIPDTRECLPLP